MKKLFLIPILLITIVACNKNKESEKVASVWNFNGQKISTKNTFVLKPHNNISLKSDDDIRFGLDVVSGFYDDYREWSLDTSDACFFLGNCAGMMVATKTPYITYSPSINTTNKLVVKNVNGKAQFHLEPTWFINYYDPNDSVLVSGDFNEP